MEANTSLYSWGIASDGMDRELFITDFLNVWKGRRVMGCPVLCKKDGECSGVKKKRFQIWRESHHVIKSLSQDCCFVYEPLPSRKWRVDSVRQQTICLWWAEQNSNGAESNGFWHGQLHGGIIITVRNWLLSWECSISGKHAKVDSANNLFQCKS